MTDKPHPADKYHLVHVEWEDAEHEGAWSSIEEEAAHQLGLVKSVGWLVHENDKRYVVAASVGDAEVGNKQYIPKGMVTKIEVLKHRRGENVKRRRRKIRGGVDDLNVTPVPERQAGGRPVVDGANDK